MVGPRFNVHIRISVREYEAGARRIDQATESVARKTRAAETQTGRWNRMLKRLRTTAVAVALGLAAISQQAAATAVRFDDSVTSINTLVGVAQERVRAWRQDLLDLGPAVGRLPTELSKSLFVVTSAGERGAEALRIVEQAGKAAAIGLGDTAAIARTVTAALQAYGAGSLGAAEATDVLVATVREGNLEASELAGALGRVLGIASQVGVGFGEVGGFIATFTRLGVNAEEAVTALRGILVQLLSPAKQSIETLAEVGLTFGELRRSIRERGLAATLVELVQQFKGNEEALATIIPNVRALAGVLGTAGSQAKQFLEIERSVIDSTGILEEAFRTVQETPGQALRSLRAELEQLAIALGDPLARGLTAALAPIRELASNREALERFGRQAAQAVRLLAEGLAFLAEHAGAAMKALLALMALGVMAWARRTALAVAGTEAWAALAGSVAAVRAGFGRLVALNLAQILTGWTAAAAGWAAALVPVALIVTSLGLAFAGVAGAVENESAAMDASITRLVEVSEDLRESWERTEEAIRSANLSTLQGELDRLSTGLGETLTRMASLDAEMAEVRSAGTLRGEVVNVAQALEQLRLEVDDAATASARFQIDIARVQERLEALRSVEGVQDLLSNYQEKLEEVRQRKEALGRTTATLEARISQLNPSVAAHVALEAELRAKLEAARRGLEEAEGQTADYEAQIASLGVRLEELTGHTEETERSVRDLGESFRELEAEAAKQERIVDLMRRAGVSAEDAAKALEILLSKDRTASEEEVLALVRRLREAKDATDELEGSYQDLERTSRELERTLLDLRAQIAAAEGLNAFAGSQETFAQEVELILDSEAFNQEIDEAFDQLGIDWLEANGHIRRVWVETADGLKETFEVLGDDLQDELIALGHAFAEILSGIDDELGRVATAAVQVFQQFQQLRSAQNAGEAALGGLQLGHTIGSFFGSSNNYAAEGGAVFGAIGAAIGSSAPGIGTAVGGLIGSAVGTLVGSIIKKGAEEASGHIEAIQGRLQGQLETWGSRVSQQVGSTLDTIAETLNHIVQSLGGEIVSIGDLGIEIREDEAVRVLVEGIRYQFESLEEALDFAIVEGLQLVEISGLAPEVETALENTVARTVDQLERDLSVAVTIRDLRLGEARTALRRQIDEFLLLLKEAQRLGIDQTGVFAGLARTLSQTRDAALGIERSQEELIRERAEAWNAERQVLEAQLLALRADIEARIADVRSRAQVRYLEIDSLEALTRASGAAIEALGGVARELIATAGVAEVSTEVLDQALAAIDQALASLPDLISESEIEAAIARQGRTSAPRSAPSAFSDEARRQQELEAWNRELESLELRLVGVTEASLRMLESLERLDAWIEAGRELGVAEERLAEARRAQLELLEQELLAGAEEIIRQAEESDFETGVRQLLERYEEQFQAAYLLAAQRAAESGGTIEEFFRPIKDVLDEALAIEFAEELEREIARLTELGDLEGLRELDAFLASLADAELPPGVREALEGILASLPDLGEIISELEAQAAAAAEAERAQGREVLDAELGAFESSAGLLSPVAESLAQVDRRMAELTQEAYSTADSLSGLEERLARIQAAGYAAVQAIGVDFLQSLEELGIEVPGLSKEVLELERAMKLAELAALATEPAFLEMLDQMGLTIDGLAEAINQFFDEAIAASESLSDSGDELAGSASRVSAAVRSIPSTGSSFAERQAERQAEFDRLLAQLRGVDTGGFESELQSILDAAERMRELQVHLDNFSLGEITELEQDAIAALLDRTLAPFERSGDRFRDRLEEINAVFETLIANAEHYPQELERILDAQQAAIQAVMDEVNAGLLELRDQLLGVDAPGLTDQERLDVAQERVDELLARVAAGDLEAQAELGAALQDLLQATADVHGSVGPAFAAIQAYVLSIIDQVLDGTFQLPLPDDRPPVDDELGKPERSRLRPGLENLYDNFHRPERTPAEEVLRATRERKVEVELDNKETNRELRGLRREVRDLARRLDALLLVGREGNAHTRALVRGVPVKRRLL